MPEGSINSHKPRCKQLIFFSYIQSMKQQVLNMATAMPPPPPKKTHSTFTSKLSIIECKRKQQFQTNFFTCNAITNGSKTLSAHICKPEANEFCPPVLKQTGQVEPQ